MSDPISSPDGGYVLRATYAPTGTNNRSIPGLWRETGGQLDAVALVNDPTPGTTGSFALLSDDPTINSTSVLAFHAWLDVTNSLVDEGIWTDRSGALGLLVREGDQAPGVPGATIGSLSSQIAMNDAGNSAFRCTLIGPDNAHNGAIYLARADGSIVLIAREGDSIADEVQTVSIATLGDPQLNDRGELVFRAYLTGLSVHRDTNQTLMGVDQHGTVYSIVREGQPVNPDGNGYRTVKGYKIDTSAAGRGRKALDNQGRVGFSVSFVDNTFGVMVSEIGFLSPADRDRDGMVTTADFVIYLNEWNANAPVADLDLSGQVNSIDYIAYLGFWLRDRE